MNDDDWQSVAKGRWHYREAAPGIWMTNRADIQVRGPTQWNLFINHIYVATFNTWEEARDATPMMLTLHGYEGNQS